MKQLLGFVLFAITWVAFLAMGICVGTCMMSYFSWDGNIAKLFSGLMFAIIGLVVAGNITEKYIE
jgi:hypothetical protein